MAAAPNYFLTIKGQLCNTFDIALGKFKLDLMKSNVRPTIPTNIRDAMKAIPVTSYSKGTLRMKILGLYKKDISQIPGEIAKLFAEHIPGYDEIPPREIAYNEFNTNLEICLLFQQSNIIDLLGVLQQLYDSFDALDAALLSSKGNMFDSTHERDPITSYKVEQSNQICQTPKKFALRNAELLCQLLIQNGITLDVLYNKAFYEIFAGMLHVLVVIVGRRCLGNLEVFWQPLIDTIHTGLGLGLASNYINVSCRQPISKIEAPRCGRAVVSHRNLLENVITIINNRSNQDDSPDLAWRQFIINNIINNNNNNNLLNVEGGSWKKRKSKRRIKKVKRKGKSRRIAKNKTTKITKKTKKIKQNWTTNDFERIKTKQFIYRKIPKNTTLYHGGFIGNEVMNLERGFYLIQKSWAKGYAKTRKGFLTSYKTIHTLFLFEINEKNIKTLLQILEDLSKKKDDIYVRKIGKIKISVAIKVIQSFTGIGITKRNVKDECMYKSKEIDKIVICSKGFEFNHTESGQYTSLVFLHILCWMGFDGYIMPHKYYRASDSYNKKPEHIFHEEIVLCFPLLHLTNLKKHYKSELKKKKK